MTIVVLGLYHGFNPAMGWPLAVANGMTVRRASAVFATLLPLATGHFLAMAVVLVPFAWLDWYLAWNLQVRLAAGVLVLAFGIRMLIARGHPRFLSRIRPTQLAWWSFLIATLHGAGLMLVPFMLGLCTAGPAETGIAGHATVMDYLARSSIHVALLVATIHTLAMLAAGMGMAWATYRYLGLRFLRRAWLNLDRVWAASLIVSGAAGIISAL